MPFGTITKKDVQRSNRNDRISRRVKRRWKRNYRIPRNPNNTVSGVLPMVKTVNLPYSARIGLSSGLGAPAFHLFNLNSIFDPDQTGTGHQPLGHDEWANFYKRYQVIGAKITAKFNWQGSGLVGQPHMCGIILDHDTTNYTSTDELVERAHGKVCRLLSNSRDSATCYAYYSSKNFFAGNKQAVDTQNVLFGYSPSYAVYGKVWAGPIDSVASVEDVQCSVNIDYLVRFTEPKDITQS